MKKKGTLSRALDCFAPRLESSGMSPGMIRSNRKELGLWNVAGRRKGRCCWNGWSCRNRGCCVCCRCHRGGCCGWCNRGWCCWHRRGNCGAFDGTGIDCGSAVGARSRFDHNRRVGHDGRAGASGATGIDCNATATGVASRSRSRCALRSNRSGAPGSSATAHFAEQSATAAVLGDRAATSCFLGVQSSKKTASTATATIVSTATGHRDGSKSRCNKSNGRQNY